jgi:hypothetical protein
MRALRGWARPIGLLFVASVAACADNPPNQPEDNGIYVGVPKVYNDKSLQILLNGLGSRLALVSGIDQTSLIAHLGSTQGASSAQTQFSLQATALPTPGVTTTASSGTPSIAQTTANTGTTYTPATTLTNTTVANNSTPSVVQTNGQTSGSGPTGATATTNTSTVTTTVSNTNGTTTQSVTTTPSNVTGTNNQTVTTTPSNTNQTVTSSPTVTPAPAPLPSTTTIALPSAYNVSSLDLLNEQMQLSYEIINLQLLLQGSVDDDYTKSGLGKRHVTLGFPISITTPQGHEGDVAEVEVSVCNVRDSDEHAAPSLRTIIPREKTYNVVSIVSDSQQLGVGAVIANIINVGASFLSGKQTYYLVRDQDTVALQRAGRAGECPGTTPVPPVTFAWQFRPVLLEKSVQPGLRQTFAQISVDPIQSSDPGFLTVTIRTCWKNYESKSRIVGKANSCNRPITSPNIQSFYDTVAIDGITQTDNGDGTITAKVTGVFPSGTRVGLGDASVNDSSVGFENTGTFIRFSAPSQLVATRGARLMSPDGLESDVVRSSFLSSQWSGSTIDVLVRGDFDDIVGVYYIDGGGALSYDANGYGITLHLPLLEAVNLERKLKFVRREGSECKLPNGASPKLPATTKPYSDTLVEVTVPIWQCMEVRPDFGGPYAPIVIVGGKAFGLSDAPFRTISPTQLTFLAPPSLVQGQAKLKLKRLFLDYSYETFYDLEPMSGLSVDGISILEVSPKETTFAVTGSQLAVSKLLYPKPVSVDSFSPAFLKFTLTQDQVSSAKQIMLASAGEAPVLYTLPSVPKPSNDSTAKISILDFSEGMGTTYAVTGAGLKDAKIVFPTLATPPETSEAYMKFLLTADQLKTVKEIVIQPAKANSDPLVLALPSAKADDGGKTTLTKDDAGVTKGSVAPYIIKGANLQHVVQLRFEKAQVLFSYGSGGTSITIPQLPIQVVAQAGSFPIEVRLDDGTKQYFTLVVK